MTTYRERHHAGIYGGEQQTAPVGTTESVEVGGDEETFICPDCGRDFGTRQGLSLHQTKAHGEEETA